MSEWSTPNGGDGFSYDDFFTAASDKRGHSEEIRLRVPPDVDAAIAHVVDQIPQFRFKTDLVRSGLYKEMHYWTHKLEDPEFDRLAGVSIRLQLAREEKISRENEKSLIEDRRTVMELASDRERVKLVEEIKKDIELVKYDSTKEELGRLVERYGK